jgi:hypothetical protein
MLNRHHNRHRSPVPGSPLARRFPDRKGSHFRANKFLTFRVREQRADCRDGRHVRHRSPAIDVVALAGGGAKSMGEWPARASARLPPSLEGGIDPAWTCSRLALAPYPLAPGSLPPAGGPSDCARHVPRSHGGGAPPQPHAEAHSRSCKVVQQSVVRCRRCALLGHESTQRRSQARLLNEPLRPPPPGILARDWSGRRHAELCAVRLRWA